jgi:hypothetical protein
MALFSSGKEQQTSNETQASQVAKDVVDEGSSYLDDMAGEGLENFTKETVSRAYLSMIQPGSTAAVTGTPGTWRNSATDENYGSSVEVVPVAFQVVWTERSKEPPYNTVGQYPPGGIQVEITRPKQGQRGFPKMTNPETGNKVEELFIYALLLKDHPDAGLLYFSPTVSSMQTCKAWNSMLRAQRLSSGRPAPIFAYSWFVDLELVQNPAKANNPNEKITKFVKARKGSLVAKELFFDAVKPQLQIASDTALIAAAASEQSGDVGAQAID